MFNVIDILEILKNNSSLAVPISLLISIGISLAGLLPSVFVTGANIIFFGPVKGFLISLLGETIGAYITFSVYRLGFKKKIEKFTDKYKLLLQIVNSEGKKAGLLILEGRIIPFIPSGFVTLAASISNVNGTIFTGATLIGKIPSIALEALVSYDIINIYDNWLRLAITIIGLVLIYFTIGKDNVKLGETKRKGKSMKKKWNVYVTREIPAPALNLLSQYCDLEINPDDQVLDREALLKKVKGRDGVLCLLTDIIDAPVFDAAKGVVIFANYAVGFNNIDIQAATERGVLITNTPGVLTESTAEMAWALLFATARRVVESDRYNREGKFKGWGPLHFLGQGITGKTLGIIGSGRIGTSFGEKAKGFDMTILYTGRAPNADFEKRTGGRYVDLATLLRESDFVSIHAPLLPETKHLIGAQELKMMKKSAILINTSRGPLVDEIALVQALKEGEIWGAGLDVYEEEPELAPGLTELSNVVICPHIASATEETRIKMGMMAAENLLAGLRGEIPSNCLNPEVIKGNLKK